MLTGKRIAITGATRGLGRAMAEVFSNAGASVAVGHRGDGAAARAVADTIGGRPMRLDVAEPGAAERAVEELRESWGGIDAWVDNAAVVRPSLLVSASDEAIEVQLQTNLLGPIRNARAVLPVMLRQRAGVILHVGSIAAAAPIRGQAVYAATKGGLESFTRALAAEYGRKGIRVYGLRPGPIDTEMLAPTLALAKGRVELAPASPTAIAEHAAFLLSDGCAAANGSIHEVS